MSCKISVPFTKEFIELSVSLPSTEIIHLHVGLNLTVEQVRDSIVKQAPSLFGFNPSDLSIGITKGEPLKDLSQSFATCHPIVKRALESRERILIFVFPKETSSNKRLPTQSSLPQIQDDEAKRRSQSVETVTVSQTSSKVIDPSSSPQLSHQVSSKTKIKSTSPPSWFGIKPGVQREAYFYVTRKDKGKIEKRWIVVSSTGFMIFKTKDVLM